MRILGRLLSSTVLFFYALLPTVTAQQGRVDFANIVPTGCLRCTPSSIFTPLAGQAMTVQRLSPLPIKSTVLTTNTNGLYNLPTTGYDTLIGITPTALGARGTVTTLDIAQLNRHILRIDLYKIACPYTRIAGDVNNDGKLDDADMLAIRQYILRITANIGTVPFVRFVPKAYTTPNAKHPDQQFVADFWNNSYVDEDGKEYPFNATVKYNKKIYTYNGSSTWVGKLNEWRYPGDACESKDWGFVAVISGDISSNQTPIGAGTSLSIVANPPVFAESLLAPNTPNTEGSYKVSLLATSTQKVSAFQLQVNINNDLVRIEDIAHGGGLMTTDVSKNVNQTPEMLKKGQLRMLWVNGLEGNAAPFVMTDTPLFSYTVSASKAMYLANMGLDTTDFPAIFYDENGKELPVKVQFKIEKNIESDARH